MALHRNRRRGSSMIELAIGMPILMMFLFGIVDFGRVFYTAIEVSNAAAAGALYGSYNTSNVNDTAGISNAASNEASDIANLSVTSSNICQDTSANTVSCATAGSYQYVKVTASVTFNTLCKYPLIPLSVQLTKTVMMRAK
jgi:Flp pilus assembly protein TadG